MNLIHLFSTTILAMALAGNPIPGNDLTKNPTPSERTTVLKEDDNDLIPWTSYRKLTWDDYLCEPQRGTDAVASTSTSLGLSYQIKDSRLSFHILCGFSKTKSWGLLKTDYILAHEQGHFDITEIYARKLNEALQNYHFSPRTFKRDINEIYNSIVKEKEDVQDAYDGETDHSRNRHVQSEWLDKIQNMLEDTEPFSQYP
jgi:Bacterial protein of unknown function (DUF922)